MFLWRFGDLRVVKCALHDSWALLCRDKKKENDGSYYFSLTNQSPSAVLMCYEGIYSDSTHSHTLHHLSLFLLSSLSIQRSSMSSSALLSPSKLSVTLFSHALELSFFLNTHTFHGILPKSFEPQHTHPVRTSSSLTNKSCLRSVHDVPLEENITKGGHRIVRYQGD